MDNPRKSQDIRRVISLSKSDTIQPQYRSRAGTAISSVHLGSNRLGFDNMSRSRGASVISIPIDPRQHSNSFVVNIDDGGYDDGGDMNNHYVSNFKCAFMPCCMDDPEATSCGHHVSIFMVALVAFATFFCVTLILLLVFLLG